MNMDGPGEITSTANQGKPEGRFFGILRIVALIAAVVGAAGSLGFMFREGQRTPRLLLIFFFFWVLSPFAALLWANIVSKRWSVMTRVALYCVTLVVALNSLLIYSELVHVKPPGAANAFLFVAVPPVSWALITIVIAIAALISRSVSRRGVDA